jgi:hypothetical protein
MEQTYHAGDFVPLTGKVGCLSHPDSNDHVFLGMTFNACGADGANAECAWHYVWVLRPKREVQTNLVPAS